MAVIKDTLRMHSCVLLMQKSHKFSKYQSRYYFKWRLEIKLKCTFHVQCTFPISCTFFKVMVQVMVFMLSSSNERTDMLEFVTLYEHFLSFLILRFLTTMTLKSSVFFVITLCSSVKVRWYFRGLVPASWRVFAGLTLWLWWRTNCVSPSCLAFAYLLRIISQKVELIVIS
jgi:hypothetical protein